MRENMDFASFQRASLQTRILLESRAERAIATRRDEADPCSPEHLSWMLADAIRFYEQGKTQKANRWLGYAQGVMAARGYATLEQLKRANMPPGEQFDPEKK